MRRGKSGSGEGGSRKHLCFHEQVATSSALGAVIDGFQGAGQDRPRPAWRGPLSSQMKFGFPPTGAAPSAFIVANSSLGNSHPPQGLQKPV